MPIYIIDANVVKNIAQGNAAAAKALISLMGMPGNRVYIATAAFNEVVNGSFGAQYRDILNEMAINTPPTTSMEKRVDALGRNVNTTVDPKGKRPGPMPEYGGKRDPATRLKSRPADAFVAAETKALNGKLWTQDLQFARQAQQQGVTIAPQSQIPSVSGPENPALARELLGFRKGAKYWKPSINIKATGITILRGLGVAVVFGIIGSWLEERKIRTDVEEALEELQPRIDEAVRNLDRLEVGKFQLRLDKGEKVYANVEFSILVSEMGGVLQMGKTHGNPKYSDVYEESGWATARLSDVKVSSKDVSMEKMQIIYGGSILAGRFITVTRSYNISIYSEGELEEFWDLSDQFFKSKRSWMNNPTSANARMVADVKAEIISRFGKEVWFLDDAL